jgi:hypothetical protein
MGHVSASSRKNSQRLGAKALAQQQRESDHGSPSRRQTHRGWCHLHLFDVSLEVGHVPHLPDVGKFAQHGAKAFPSRLDDIVCGEGIVVILADGPERTLQTPVAGGVAMGGWAR